MGSKSLLRKTAKEHGINDTLLFAEVRAACVALTGTAKWDCARASEAVTKSVLAQYGLGHQWGNGFFAILHSDLYTWANAMAEGVDPGRLDAFLETRW